MDFSDAVTYFDDIPVYDSYSGIFLFYGQMDLYDGTERDSIIANRRSISIATDVSIPSSQTIKIDTDNYVVGKEIKDFFDGSSIRKHFIIHQSNVTSPVQTPAGYIDNIGVTNKYIAKSWRKQIRDEKETSQIFQIYNFYFPASDDVSIGQIIPDGDRLYKVAGLESTTAGFLLAVCYELDESAYQTIQYTPITKVYDPSTDSRVEESSVNILAIVDRYSLDYEINFPSSDRFNLGDKTINISASDIVQPVSGDQVIIDFTEFRVVSFIYDGSGGWLLHAVPV